MPRSPSAPTESLTPRLLAAQYGTRGEINTLAVGSVIDPWNYVVAVLVCMTITTDEQGTSATTTNNRASRCPLDPGEAETGLDLVATTTDGRIRRTFSQVFTVRAKATASPSLL